MNYQFMRCALDLEGGEGQSPDARNDWKTIQIWQYGPRYDHQQAC